MVSSTAPFTSLIPVSIEASDVLFVSDPPTINYSLLIGAGYEDGFDFSIASGAAGCFGLDMDFPLETPVYLGAARTPVEPPFDLATLSPCVPSAPVVSINSISVNEDDLTGQASFILSLSAANILPISVDVTTIDGTAVAPGDFAALTSSTVSFLPGETTATIDIAIVDDILAESDEVFTVGLSNPVNAILSTVPGTASGTGTIVDND